MVNYIPFVSGPEDSELTDLAHLGWTGSKKHQLIVFLLIRESMAVLEVGSVSMVNILQHFMVEKAPIMLSRAHYNAD